MGQKMSGYAACLSKPDVSHITFEIFDIEKHDAQVRALDKSVFSHDRPIYVASPDLHGIVVVCMHRVIGFLFFTRHEAEHKLLHHCIQIETLLIAPPHQRCGHGRRLFDQMIDMFGPDHIIRITLKQKHPFVGMLAHDFLFRTDHALVHQLHVHLRPKLSSPDVLYALNQLHRDTQEQEHEHEQKEILSPSYDKSLEWVRMPSKAVVRKR